MLDSTLQKRKIRRVTTACDNCRSKKVRCSGALLPENRCSICVASNLDCTYRRVAKKRGPPSEYISILEARLRQVEQLLHKRCPDIDIAQELKKIEQTPLQDSSQRESSTSLDSLKSNCVVGDAAAVDQDYDSSDYESAMVDIMDRMTHLRLDRYNRQFYGRSSIVGSVRTLLDMKHGSSVFPYSDYKKSNSNSQGGNRDQYWLGDQSLDTDDAQNLRLDYQYPEPKLLSRLVDAFFKEFNLFLPLLHQPSFKQAIASGLHLHEEGFASVLLMVCAVSARRSSDPTLNVGSDDSNVSLWVSQIQKDHQSLFSHPSIFDVQFYFLTAFYHLHTASPSTAWVPLGIGIRLCQGVGAHRRKTFGPKPTYEGELWKRAFWCCLALELRLACAFGRQSSLREEDYDLEYPLECDDEYWSHPDPEQAFLQPSGNPSTISYFVCVIKQSNILGSILRKLYSTKKAKASFNLLGPEKEKMIVAGFDSALDEWFSSVPDHLKWNPDIETPTFTKLSGHLYTNYLHLRILVHRPFINLPRPSSVSKSELPSWSVCVNAARLCSEVMNTLHTNFDGMTNFLMLPLFTSAVLLILNLWGSKNDEQTDDRMKDLKALQTLLKISKDMARRSPPAATTWSALASLATTDNSEIFDLMKELVRRGTPDAEEAVVPSDVDHESPLALDTHRFNNQWEFTPQRWPLLQAQQSLYESPYLQESTPYESFSATSGRSAIASYPEENSSVVQAMMPSVESAPRVFHPNQFYDETVPNVNSCPCSAYPQPCIRCLDGGALAPVPLELGTSELTNAPADRVYPGLDSTDHEPAVNAANLIWDERDLYPAPNLLAHDYC